jgi:hypothetical protein
MRLRFFPRKFAFLMLVVVFAVPAATLAQQPRKESLLNGLKVLMFPEPSADKVVVRIRVNSGAAFDPQGKEGLMAALANNFFPTDAAKEYFRDELGGTLQLHVTYDYIEVAASAKPDSFIPMMETLSGGITSSVIDKETTANVKADLAANVAKLGADPSYVAENAAASRLFGTFPYGRPVLGTVDSIKKIEPGDLIGAKQRFLTADNAVMTISGVFQPQQATQAVKRYFGGWLKSGVKVPATYRQPDAPRPGLLTLQSPVAGQFAIRVSLRGTARSAADMAAADVYARIIEARLKARLPLADSGNVFVRSDAFVLPGSIVIGFSGTNGEVGNANGKIDINDLLPKVLGDTITDSEFAAARSAAASDWTKWAPEKFWLDADTYGTNPQIDRAAFDTLTVVKVRDFATWASRQPIASVLVNTPK